MSLHPEECIVDSGDHLVRASHNYCNSGDFPLDWMRLLTQTYLLSGRMQNLTDGHDRPSYGEWPPSEVGEWNDVMQLVGIVLSCGR